MSIFSLRILEIVIYTITSATPYTFVSPNVQSRALLPTSSIVSKIAFSIALPVIFISGSINTIMASGLILTRAFEHSVIRCMNTPRG